MDLILYGGTSQALSTLTREQLEQQVAEQEKRQKEAEELEAKLKKINEEVPTRTFNVMGSCAGAGSGEFHIFRAIRRKEQDRLKRMDEEDAQAKADIKFQAKKEQAAKELEERTSKKRSKRQKKKEKAKKAKKGADGSAAEASAAAAAASSSDESDAPEQAALD